MLIQIVKNLNLLTKEILRLQEENEKLKSRLKVIEAQVIRKPWRGLTGPPTGGP